jgi:hypothetical protein
MAEPPDFDQIARLLATLPHLDAGTDVLAAGIAEQLRQVWNARGAADLKILALPISEIHAAIRALDR